MRRLVNNWDKPAVAIANCRPLRLRISILGNFAAKAAEKRRFCWNECSFGRWKGWLQLGLRAFLSCDPVHMYLMRGDNVPINVTIDAVFAAISAAQEKFSMNSDKARERAEKSFKKEERAQDGRKAMIEYEFSGTSHSREDRTFEGASIS